MSKEENKPKHAGEESLAARRAKLRSSLTTQAISPPTNTPTPSSHELDAAISDADNLPLTTVSDTQTLELLGNIDQALSSCATHLVSLQKVASKQIDELKIIADTLQHKSIPEAGLNINILMESLTAAIEPMKAIGELVPALDRLVSISTLKTEPPKSQLSEKQLLLSLAQQLSSGGIDPPTFKSAYQAIFPEYDLNGLLHQLSELLGEQQLSGDLFQAAFAAIQTEATSSGISEQISNWSPETLSENTPSALAQVSTSEHEAELEKELADKEMELAQLKESLDQRWHDMNNAYEELRSTLQSRDNVLQEKESELTAKISELSLKNSENQQLRAQMEELRDQTKEMVTDLQKQLAQKHAEEKATRSAKAKTAATPPQPGFFEMFTPAQQAQENQNETAIISANAISQLAPVAPITANPTRPDNQMPVHAATKASEPALPNAAPAPGLANPSASFVSAAGSYGSGVRAQVFEVIVRQALAGAHWREICAVPMQINNISPDEVESEVKRRQALLKK